MDSFWNALWEGSEYLIRGIRAVFQFLAGLAILLFLALLAATIVMGFVRVFQWAWGG